MFLHLTLKIPSVLNSRLPCPRWRAQSHIVLEYNNEIMRFIRLLLANQIAYFFSDLMIDDCIYVIHIYVIFWYNTTTHLQNYHYATIQVQIQNYGTIMWRRAYFTIKARAKITLHSFNDDLDPRIDHKLLFINLMPKWMYLFCCVFCK